MLWKDRTENPIAVFSNLKILCQTYPAYSYNLLNTYLSKAKVAYEDHQVRIERLVIGTKPVPGRQINMVAKRVSMREHEEAAQDTAYWLSRPAAERLEAVTRLSATLKRQKNERMDKTHVIKRKL